MSLGDLALLFLAGGVVVGAVLAVREGARRLYLLRRRGQSGPRLAHLGGELDRELELVLRRVDAVRRDEAPPADVVALVSRAVDAVAEAERTVKALPVAAERAATRDAFELELIHAARALEAILDACMSLEGSSRVERRTRALTTLKWAHLNLYRARASMAEQAHVLDDAERRDSGWHASRI